MKSTISVALIFVIAASSLAILGIEARAQQPISGAISLAVVPPQLPADGKAYESLIIQVLNNGLPVIQKSRVNISMTSSKTSVGNVDSSVTIKPGEFFTKAKFYTTLTSGSTEVTALAEGYGAAKVVVPTVIAGGTPFQLAVYLGPESLLPDRGLISTVVVQLQDLKGVPARAPSDVPVTLASSRTTIGSVTPTTVILAGNTFATATYSATDAAGSTIITASASGYAAGSAVVSSRGPTPRNLVVFAAPSVIRAMTGEESWIAVQLRDFDGRPAKAPFDILLSLSSSNSIVGRVVASATIIAGSSHAMARFTANGTAGRTEVTASSPGLLSGSATLRAVAPSATPSAVRLYLAPDSVLPNSGEYQSVVVQLENATGFPSALLSTQNIILSSSNTEVGRVPDTILIPAGKSFGVAPFQATFLAGTTQITAHGPGLAKGEAMMSTSGPVPSRLVVYSVPRLVPADGSTYRAVLVQLQDGTGSPAKAPRDIRVSLSSSRTDIGSVPSDFLIPSGATYALVDFRSTATAGRTIITATASGYDPFSYELITVEPYPSRLTVYAMLPAVLANGKTYDSIVVQLQDSGGNPATLPNPLPISLASSSSALAKVDGKSVIQIGSTFTVVPLQTNTSEGEFNIFAFAPGFTTGSVVVRAAAIPMSLAVNPGGSLTLKGGQVVEFTLQAVSELGPIAGATVSVSTTLGTASPASSSTDENGIARISYSANSPGAALLALGASAQGYRPTSVTVSINVSDEGTIPVLDALGRFQGIPILLIPIIGAGAAAGFFFMKRRKPKGEVEELDYPTETT